MALSDRVRRIEEKIAQKRALQSQSLSIDWDGFFASEGGPEQAIAFITDLLAQQDEIARLTASPYPADHELARKLDAESCRKAARLERYYKPCRT